jgi:hypothetical protein
MVKAWKGTAVDGFEADLIPAEAARTHNSFIAAEAGNCVEPWFFARPTVYPEECQSARKLLLAEFQQQPASGCGEQCGEFQSRP